LEVAEQIVTYLRSKFVKIRAFIPQNAMSAATMIACACDEIVMGKQSALGPIDPQVTLLTANGPFAVAAHSVLQEFQAAQDAVAADPRVAPLWVTKIKDYPVGLLDSCKQNIALSEAIVADWLSKYMFKGESDAKDKGKRIANWLGRASLHKTHGRPISFAEAQKQGLKVIALEENQELQDLLLSVFHAMCITFETTGCVKVIENQDEKGWYVVAMPGMPGMMPGMPVPKQPNAPPPSPPTPNVPS
jgi:hypothetical protein